MEHFIEGFFNPFYSGAVDIDETHHLTANLAVRVESLVFVCEVKAGCF